MMTSRIDQALAWRPRLEHSIWLVPLLAGWVVVNDHELPFVSVTTGSAAILGLGLVLATMQRPDLALLAIVVVLPFQLVVMSWLYARGLPLGLLQPLGYWKDVVLLGLVVAACRGGSEERGRLDGLDALVLTVVGFAAAYALVPTFFAAGAPTDLQVRYTGFRELVGFLLVFLAARHIPMRPGTALRATRLVIGVALVTATVGVYEWAFSDRWNTFVVETLAVPTYLRDVGTPVLDPLDVRIYSVIGGRQVLRVASVFLTLGFGFFLLLPIALLVARLATRSETVKFGVLLGLTGTALLMTQTRSVLVGAILATAVAVRGRPGARAVASAARVRVSLLLAAALLVAIPAAINSGLADRFRGATTGADEAQAQHQDSLGRGFDALWNHPLGSGLGTTAGAGQRYGTAVVVADNSYLQIGNEIGVVPMLAFMALLAAAAKQFGSSRHHSSAAAQGMRAAIIGVAVAGFFLQAWLDLATSWTFWALAGLLLARPPDDVVAGNAAPELSAVAVGHVLHPGAKNMSGLAGGGVDHGATSR